MWAFYHLGIIRFFPPLYHLKKFRTCDELKLLWNCKRPLTDPAQTAAVLSEFKKPAKTEVGCFVCVCSEVNNPIRRSYWYASA